MEPETLLSASANQTALQQAELAALLRMLSISEGTFSLSLAICNSPALREYLIAKVKEQKAHIEQIRVEENCADLLAFAEKKVTTKTPSAIFITEIENVLSSDEVQPRIIGNLNASRELWQERFSCPVVFWLPEYAATMLQKNALDFASWISHIFEFVSGQATAMAGTLDAYAGDITSAGRLGADQKRFRIAELEQRIEDAGDPPKVQLVQHVLAWLNELAYIYDAIGDLDRAEENVLRSLRIAEELNLPPTMGGAYANLGLIYQTRGDLAKAEQMLNKSVEIHEKIGRLGGAASAYGTLGLIYRTRGDLDKAEQMHKKALKINEKLGRLEGMAIQYGNLGPIYMMRGDLNKAEQMLKKSLEVEEKLGRLEGMASDYGNLGLIYRMWGDLDKAEQMHNKALEINEKLGRLEGVASEYSNLGLIYQTRGDIDKAEQMHNKSLEIFEKLGRLNGMAIQYGNLGLVYRMRGDLDKAEQMHNKALEIDAKLGQLEGMANQYGNLGSVYRERRDFDKAKGYWKKAMELFGKIGMKLEIEKTQKLIDELRTEEGGQKTDGG